MSERYVPRPPIQPEAAKVAAKIEGVAEGVAEAVAGDARVNGLPLTLDQARAEVQASRARIEATLDRLENRVVETKETLKRKANIARPVTEFVRERPFVAIGAAVAIGLFLGTRGGSDEEEEDDEFGFDKRERRALDEWRKRRRRMLLAEAEDRSVFVDEDDEPPGRVSRFFRAIGHEAAGVVLGVVGAEVAERMYGARAQGSQDDDDEIDDD